jgi:phosphate transport system substrate-binding protein
MKIGSYLLLVSICFLISCNRKPQGGKIYDTPVSGNLTLVADESLRPIVEAEVDAFNGIYTKAHLKVVYVSETEALNALLNDTVPVAVLTRRLTQDEKKALLSRTLEALEADVAVSGIALIVNRSVQDTSIRVSELKEILAGKIKSWNQLGSKSKSDIKVVFDNPTSGLIRMLKDSVAKVDKLPGNCFAVNTNAAVVDYVAKNPDALGLIGLEWVSDKNDSTSNSFLEKVKVMAVAGDSAYFQPYQAYIALKYYPLMRKITVINRQSYTGLGHGFASFFASPPGQRIVLKSGLVPATMPLRIVEVNKEPFEIEK